MSPENTLSRHVDAFFHDYLVRQRDLSPNTILSYRDTLKLFFQFAATRLATTVVDLPVDLLNAELVLVFLDHLEQDRKNSAATRNVRLSALHAFFRHIAAQDPLLFDQCRRVVDIPIKRAANPAVEYLEVEEIEAILQAIDRSTPEGRRDFTLLSLTYQTGARVQEILNLRACDLQLTPPAWVRLMGKGRKERVIPLWSQTADLLRDLMAERRIAPGSTSVVFANLRGRRLTRWGFRHILQKHVRAVEASGNQSIAGKHIHPHLIRHTTAVHMLQAGADPNSIRDFLGHATSETTWRYARITMQMKRKAAEACASDLDVPVHPTPIWHQDAGVLAYLESIGRQNDYVAQNQQGNQKKQGLTAVNST